MVTPIPALPDPPSRSTQTNAEFSLAADAFLGALPDWSTALNLFGTEMEDAVTSAGNFATAASDDADRAEAAAAYRVSIGFKLWATLGGVTGAELGQLAAVFGPDAGTHTDPVVGGTVDNIGIYRWSVSPAGWEWISDGTGGGVAWDDITSKPATFAPSSHSHVISDTTGLQTALDGKAAVGAIGSSGLTMATAKLLGRTTASTGAAEEITVGAGLTLIAGELAATEGGMVYPGAGIAVSTGTAWASSLTVPSGALVGTTSTSTLTNKTLSTGTSFSAGTITAGPSVSDSGTITVDSVGFRGLPRVTGSTKTLAATDEGKVLSLTGTCTIPANGSVALPIGFACAIYNNSASSIAINITTDTLRLAGTTTTGNRTLAPRGLCTVTKVNTTEWVSSGAGLS